MSLIFGAIAGGLAGGGAAGEKALGRMQEHEQQKSLEELRAELMFEKQSRLNEQMHGFNVSLEKEVRQPFQKAEREAGFKHAEALQAAGFKHAEGLQEARLRFEESWNDKNYQLKKQEMAATRAYQGASLGLQRAQLEKNDIWQDPTTGAYWVVESRTKKIVGAFNKPGTEEQMTGPRPLNDATKAMVEGTFQMSAALLKSYDPADRKMGESYYQLGMNMMRSKEDLAAEMPPPKAIAKYVDILKKGDVAVIEQAKKDLTTTFPKYAPVVIESFSGVTATPPAPAAGTKTPGKKTPGIVEKEATPLPGSGYSAYGPLTSWKEIERAYDAGDPAAVKYVREYLDNRQFGGAMPQSLKDKVKQRPDW